MHADFLTDVSVRTIGNARTDLARPAPVMRDAKSIEAPDRMQQSRYGSGRASFRLIDNPRRRRDRLAPLWGSACLEQSERAGEIDKPDDGGNKIMRLVKAGLAVLASAALIVLGGLVGSAAARLFTWTGELGKLVLFTGEGEQVFGFTGGNVECSTLKMDTSTGAARSLTGGGSGSYSSCTAFGFAALVSKVEYEFNADESMAVVKEFTISSMTLKCTVKISTAGNAGLKTVKYANVGNGFLATIAVKKVSYKVEGGGGTSCGPEGTESNGTIDGKISVTVDAAGTLAWS